MVSVAIGVAVFVLILLARRRSKALSGKREIVYNALPIPGRLRKPRKGERL